MSSWLLRAALICGPMLALASGLAFALHHALADLTTEASVAPSGQPPMPMPFDVLEFDPPPAAMFAELLERPPFSPTRRPPVEEEKPAPPLPEKPVEALPAGPEFVLVGVSLLTDGPARALLVAKEAERPIWLGKGESLEGWQLEAIEPSRIRLRQGTRQAIIELRRAGDVGPAKGLAPSRTNLAPGREIGTANRKP